MTLLVLLVVWCALSPVLALACGAFIKAGKGPGVEAPLHQVTRLEDGSDADGGPRSTSPIEDIAA